MRLVRMMVSSVLCAAPLMAQQGADTLARIAGATVAAPNTEWVRVRGSASMTLRQPVSLALHGATVADALAELGRASGLRFYYGADVQRAAGRISLHVDNLPLAQALDDILDGTGLEAFVATHGTAVLIRRADIELPAPMWQPGTGTITGHVTDASLKTPLSSVSVRIEGTALSTTADADGKYTITGVAPGTYHVTARRVGYQLLAKDVTVAADQQVTLDFALTAAPTRLDEVVTTAVGQQRRYEVGNDISTINADSIAPTAPITSLTDLISARAPGVTVLETGGLTGSGEAIRIEGLTSLVLQNDPILIVDGVRQDNSAGADINSYFGTIQSNGHPTPTRLNDIDFSDIESIDILKGPSASTEYGTDAANGVIVVRTKHGSAGAPLWKLAAEQTESDIPDRFPNQYYTWGHPSSGSSTAVNCELTPYSSGYGSISGTCVADSVTQWNPLNHSATSIFTTGDRAKYDLSVGGGSEAARYFVSGGLSNENGVIQMPPVFKELADTAALGLPGAALHANTEQQRSARVNTAVRLGPTADLSANASYLSTYQVTPDAGGLYVGALYSPALSDPAHDYGYQAFGSPVLTPLSQLTHIGSQGTDRVVGGLTANWRPLGWFVGHATAGVDHGSQRSTTLDYPLTNATYENSTPFLGLVNATTDVYSVDIRGTATGHIGRTVRTSTSGGAQMVDTRMAGQAAGAFNITPTNPTLNGATGPVVMQQSAREATLGGYGEEEVSIADRLFVTGALRVDAASGFGRAYATAVYPKTSMSWLAINEGGATVRLRGAFGESGVQPTNGAAAQLFTPVVVYTGGTTVTSDALSWAGNPALRPERSAEFEGGVDLTAFANRLNLDLTGYDKTTQDALVNIDVGPVLGYTYQENIGEVRNTGLEGSAIIGLIVGRVVTWDLGLNASVNRNELLSLAPGVSAQAIGVIAAQLRQAPGYPLYGIWAQRATYRDANHDGIIEPNEITLADSATYQGSSLPTQEISASTHVGLWGGALALGVLADYRGGYKIVNAVPLLADIGGNMPEANLPTAPLWRQARAIECQNNCSALNDEDGSFVRLREVSVTYAVPRSVLLWLRGKSLSVTAAARNLALWTRYSGVDPEVTNTLARNLQPTLGSNAFTVNNDVREDLGSVPLARYWVLRLNVGL